MAATPEKQGVPPFNTYFVPENDLQYLPPYLRDVPETPKEVKCATAGEWPTWLEGTFLRYVSPQNYCVFMRRQL
jgi:torulene dioxygenase